MAARVYDEVFGYIEDATKTLPGAAAPGELPGELPPSSIAIAEFKVPAAVRIRVPTADCRDAIHDVPLKFKWY